MKKALRTKSWSQMMMQNYQLFQMALMKRSLVILVNKIPMIQMVNRTILSQASSNRSQNKMLLLTSTKEMIGRLNWPFVKTSLNNSSKSRSCKKWSFKKKRLRIGRRSWSRNKKWRTLSRRSKTKWRPLKRPKRLSRMNGLDQTIIKNRY